MTAPTLTEFLLARIAEDEAEARKAIEMRQSAVGEVEPDMDFRAWEDIGIPCVVVGAERVLAECEAKRQIVDECERSLLNDSDPSTADWIARHLATVHADHPDFDEAWRP